MKRLPQKRGRLSVLLVLVAAVVLGPAGAVRGEDSIFEAIADVAKLFAVPERADIELDLVNQFMPQLTKVLDVELHFAHKVCRFNAQQLAAVTAAGRAQVAVIAKGFARVQNNNNRRNGAFVIAVQGGNWPDARKLLTDALQQTIDELVPAETAERYREEVAGRHKAKREAAGEMMTMLIDRRLMLSPQQYDAVNAAIDRRWDNAWSTNMQVYLYEDHAPMPNANVLRPHLTVRQRAMWQGRANQGTINFGWEQDLGVAMPWGNVEGEFLILDAE